MGYSAVYVRDIVKRSIEHNWSIPEFQRGFVWKTTQVRDLIDSLWLDYPVGTLLIWDSSGGIVTLAGFAIKLRQFHASRRSNIKPLAGTIRDQSGVPRVNVTKPSHRRATSSSSTLVRRQQLPSKTTDPRGDSCVERSS